jgi:hypothetical protein
MPATEDAPSGDEVVCGRAAKRRETSCHKSSEGLPNGNLNHKIFKFIALQERKRALSELNIYIIAIHNVKKEFHSVMKSLWKNFRRY